MRIGELSRRSGASVRAIRHYDRQGLVASRRLQNGYREFDGSMVERVRVIRDLIGAGFTVDELRSLAECLQACPDDGRCSARTATLYRRKLDRVDGQMRALATLRRRLRERLAALGKEPQ
ncbi:MAG: MerR family transcriptional regulator [Gemmatimonadales bacterium]